MRGKNLKNRVLNLLLIIIMLFISISIPETTTAAPKYIKVNEFINQLVQTFKIDVNTTSNQPYIDAAISIGILKSEDFSNYDDYITRTDACVLLDRADEYLHGTNTLDEKLYNFVLTKRISDINKIAENKRTAVANIVAKGIVKGYSNGYYIQNREFRGSKYLTKTGATDTINLVLNPNKRAKLSPDGMLIRTTKLPKNAKNYEYILECYPNAFYEKQFDFMFWSNFKDNDKSNDRFYYPVQMKNINWINATQQWPMKEEMEKYLYEWSYKAENYLEHIFNVDYRTVNTKWRDELSAMYAMPIYSTVDDGEPQDIDAYFKFLKKNKIVIESDIIAVEPSSFYMSNGFYYMRAYVKYRITADDELDEALYSRYTDFNNLKNGKWRYGVYDICFGNDKKNGDNMNGSNLAIRLQTELRDSCNVRIR